MKARVIGLLRVAGILISIAVAGSQAPAVGNVQRAINPFASTGEWGQPFDLHVIAIHSVLLQNGKVLFWQYPPNTTGAGSPAGLWDSSTGKLTDVTMPYKRDIFCGAEVHLPDGRVFIVGGMAFYAQGDIGTKETDFFDPATQTWSHGPLMQYERWYPSALELPSGDVLALGGQHNDHFVTKQVEHYHVASNRFTTLPRSANLDIGLFPRAFVLPNGLIFRGGDGQDTELFNPTTAKWTFVDFFKIGNRFSLASVLLPGLHEVLAIGGAPDGVHATNTVERINLAAPAPKWRYTAPMRFKRVDPNAVLLPDGTVLVVGGGLTDPYGYPQRHAELYDPQSETWTVLAQQRARRVYHSTAILLPDARVFSAGSDDPKSNMQTFAEIFSPPYLFKGPRPVIGGAPSSLTYGQHFAIRTSQAGNIKRVAFIKLGATTHATNFEQRFVDLTFTRRTEQLLATAPAGPTFAPPGWYMLFIVDQTGVPSRAAMTLLR